MLGFWVVLEANCFIVLSENSLFHAEKDLAVQFSMYGKGESVGLQTASTQSCSE